MANVLFLKLTAMDNSPVWINMDKVWRIREAREGGSLLYITTGEYRHLVKETPEEIVAEFDERELE